MGIRNVIRRAGEKAGDSVAKLSKLSPAQLKDIEEKRERYLGEMMKDDPSSAENQELAARLLAANSVEAFNSYLPQLKELYVPVDNQAEYGKESENDDDPMGKFGSSYNIRFFDITKWVTDSKENSLEKLVNVYEVLSNEVCNIALVFRRVTNAVEAYIAVSNTSNADDNNDSNDFAKRLADALRGNFPGSQLGLRQSGRIPFLENGKNYSVACATNVPAEKSEKFASQTIEKLLDGIVPQTEEEEYCLILLATPILDIENRKLQLADYYSGLAPYAQWQTSFTYTESDANSSMATFGVNVGASAGIQNGQNASQGVSSGQTDSTGLSDTRSEGESDSKSASHSENENICKTEGRGTSETIDAGIDAGIRFGGSMGLNQNSSTGTTKGTASSVSESLAKTTGRAIGQTLGRAVSKTVSTTTGVFSSTSLGVNVGANFARSSTTNVMIGKNEGITQSFTNFNVKHALDLLDQQMKRMEESSALGMWEFAAYVLCEDANVANNVAHTYIALTQGEASYMSHAAVNLWRGDLAYGDEADRAKEICIYLRDLRHPIFGLSPAITTKEPYFNVYPPFVTATSNLTGKELAYALNFPSKSLPGLPVLTCAEFGRSVVTYEGAGLRSTRFVLGAAFHMHRAEDGVHVALSKDSLASHTFITGSTGAGKSNTVYRLLGEAEKEGVGFLVIEPAKGEYKHIFGSQPDVNVYGTNPDLTPLLKLNPFSFPAGIHVLEHLDRLVEIFNVCWPMYAAMPAVLKNAVERSYVDCGWDLLTSKNGYGDAMWPTFADVARNVKTIINSSEYDAENKGAYKGSLLTRLESLTNGINGLVFSGDVPASTLFDQKTIVDLSRVGSSETKSLIMGVLVLKLQEHRMTDSAGANAALRHITVLEEAHNLLKRTSTEQSSEGANLLGKSVEMISNAIAEMRTYGEGFVIADQAPGLLDMAAIRNTNTKIIMRLPDLSDRELVGRAANLDDDQIAELAKLPRGVAAVYQNEWVQPVLCKVERFEAPASGYSYEPQAEYGPRLDGGRALDIALKLSQGAKLDRRAVLRDIKPILDAMGIRASMQISIMKLLEKPTLEPRMTEWAPMMSALFPTVRDAVKESCEESDNAESWTDAAKTALKRATQVIVDGQVKRDIIQAVITDYLYNELGDTERLELWSKKGGLR